MSNKILKRGAVAGLLAVFLGGSLVACSGGTSPNPDETGDGTLTLALTSAVGSWNPSQQVSAGDATWWWGAVYDTLLRCDNPDGTPEPGAAESFEFSEDSRVLSLQLREGMTFEDGSPVDSSAVKASIENMQTGNGPDSSRVAGITIETPDESTIILTSPEPNGQLPSFMCLAPGAIASPEALSSSDVDSVPVSSGPYVLDTANTTSGSVYTYEKRDDYWDSDSYPYETLILKPMPDPTARLNALKTGEIDGGLLDLANSAEAKASGITVLEDVATFAGIFLADRNGTKVPALGDARVRQAINMVFDREAILNGIFQNEGTATSQIFPEDSDVFLEDLNEQYPYDVEAAKELMSEAGYENGFDVEIPQWSPLTDQANPLIVQQLAELNIRATEVPLTATTAITEIISGRFPLYYFTLPSTDDALFNTMLVAAPDAIWNTSHSTNDELDAMLDAAQTLRGEEATANFRDINRFLVEEAWFAPWANPLNYFGLTRENLVPEVTNVYFPPLPSLSDFK